MMNVNEYRALGFAAYTVDDELQRTAEMLVHQAEHLGPYFAVAFMLDAQYVETPRFEKLLSYLLRQRGAVKRVGYVINPLNPSDVINTTLTHGVFFTAAALCEASVSREQVKKLLEGMLLLPDSLNPNRPCYT